MRQILVWDLAIRVFHWLLVLLVVVCFLTGEDEGLVFAIHAYAGFVVLMLMVFRLGWGLIGSRHARFVDFVYGWPTVRRYLLSMLRLKPERFTGHNPLGGWMIVLILAMLTAIAVTGILIVTAGVGWLDDIHEALGTAMEVIVLVHIAGVLADRLLTGDKLVRAMITGRKEVPAEAAEPVTKGAGPVRAVILAGLVLAGSVYLFQQIDYAGQVTAFARQDEHGAKARNDDD